jgi:S1-C subfamily serine protease
MFDMDGRVIGIVSTMMSHSGGSEGLAFATAANTIDITAPKGTEAGAANENYEKIYDSIAGLKTGDTLVVTVFRGGKVLKLTAAIDK